MDKVQGLERENLILIPALAIFFMGSFLLYRDLNLSSNLDTSALTKIGNSVSVMHEVKRRYVGDMIWNDLDMKASIYQKDTLQTGNDSNLEIRFDDGSILTLGENSLVELDITEDRLSVDISQGAISTKAGEGAKAMALKLGEKTIETKGSVDLNLGKKGEVQLSVAEGTASVQVDGKEIIVEKNQLGTVSEKGLEIMEIPFERVFPAQGRVLVPVKGKIPQKSVPFRWNTVTHVDSMKIEISRSSSFEKIAFSKTVSNEKGLQQYRLKMSPGEYFWRLVAEKNGSEILRGPAWHLSIIGLHSLNLISPANQVALLTSEQDSGVIFEWQNLKNNAEYEFELFRSLGDEKTESIKKINTRENSVELKGLAAGSYEWSVTANVPLALSRVGSEKGSFTLRELKELPALEKFLPENGASIPWLKGRAIALSWKPSEGASYYNVSVERLPADESVQKPALVFQKKVSAAVAAFESESLGSFRWSVQALSDGAKPSQVVKNHFSLSDEISVRVLSPAGGQAFEKVIDQGALKIPFVWKKMDEDARAKVLISRDGGFSEIERQIEVDSEASLEIPWEKTGKWFWKVIVFDENEKPLRASAVMEFDVFSVSNSVQMANPTDDSEFSGFAKQKISFNWENAQGAASYEFVLRKIEKRKPSSSEGSSELRIKTDKTSIEVSDIGFGNFEWAVRGISPEGRAGKNSEWRRFTHVRKVIPPPSEIFVPEIK